MSNHLQTTGEKQVFSTFHDALKDLEAGIIQTDKSGNIRYANQAFCQMAGIETWRDLTLRDLFANQDEFEAINARAQNRMAFGTGEDYTVEITRRSDNRKVEVDITAVPETTSTGEVLGSFAIVRDRTVDSASDEIHRHINEQRDVQEMLSNISVVLGELIPFDYLSVTLYSTEETHLRELFRTADIELPEWPVRWYELPDIARRFTEQRRTLRIGDLVQMLREPEWSDVWEQQTTQDFLKLGYRACLWHPILHEGRVAASMTLYRRQADAFDERDETIIESLPIRRALTSVCSYLERDEMQFRLSLVRDIAASDVDVNEAARTITKQVSRHYGWSNVSLFTVDEEQEQFVLLNQYTESNQYAYQKTFNQPLDQGVLGYVYKHKQSVNIGNLAADNRFGDVFLREMRARPLSELAIPIIVDGNVCAILNSEDIRENAYSSEEQHALEIVLYEVASLYQRLEMSETLSAIQESASDGIVRTSPTGVIRQANSSALKLLGCNESEAVGQRFTDFLEDGELAAHAAKAERLAPDEVRIKRCDDGAASVLLSSSTLPEHIGGRVYMLSDLSLRKKIEHLESMRRIYRELGSQSQPAISLCFSWLRRLIADSDPRTVDTLEKVVKQLKKVQLTFDRLSLAERPEGILPHNPVLLSLPRMVQQVIKEFPTWQVEYLLVEAQDNLPMIRGDYFQVAFCIKSILSYLIRFVPENDKIIIVLSSDQRSVSIEISGQTPVMLQDPDLSVAETEALSHAKFELALGLTTMVGLVKQNNGTFKGPERSGNTEHFEMTFPSEEEED